MAAQPCIVDEASGVGNRIGLISAMWGLDVGRWQPSSENVSEARGLLRRAESEDEVGSDVAWN